MPSVSNNNCRKQKRESRKRSRQQIQQPNDKDEEEEDVKKKSAKKRTSTDISKGNNRTKNGKVDIKHDDDDPESSLVTPHTLRLLKLIQEGSLEHAQLAAVQLAAITSQSPPVVLWDILGRLQYYLTSPDWRCRHNAAMAMEGVAQHLPIWDQRSFLQDTRGLQQEHEQQQLKQETKNDMNGEDDDGNNNDHNRQQHDQQGEWLSLNDLKGKMDIILSNGRILLAYPEDLYDDDEEQISNFDNDLKGTIDFCESRLELQRKILARRLGLSSIMNFNNGKEVVEQVLSSNEDLNGNTGRNSTTTTTASTKKQKKQKKASAKKSTSKGADDPSSSKETSSSSLRALLIMEIRQQQQQQQQKRGHDQVASSSTVNQHHSNIVSHRNAQMLLAGELVYRMFDASWHVRHGSLMGVLALIRAWNVHQSADNFGSWPHDILARTLCLVGLDRFADYSGSSVMETTASSFSTVGSGAVAPVREVAGQVFSVIFPSSPPQIQRDCFYVLRSLLQNEDWEVRHGALVAMKYCVALVCNETASGSHPAGREHTALIDDACSIAITKLEDESDDVQSVAAQLLIGSFSTTKQQQKQYTNISIAAAINPLWRSIEKANDVSSAIKDLISLFATLVSIDCEGILKHLIANDKDDGAGIGCGNEKWASCHRLLSRLKDLLDFDYTSVQTSVLKTIASLVSNLSASCQHDRRINEKSNCEDMKKKTIICISQIMIKVFDLHLHKFTVIANTEDSRNELDSLLTIWNESWTVLTKTSRNSMLMPEDDRSDLGSSLLCRYFCGIEYYNQHAGSSHSIYHKPYDASHGKNLQLRLVAAKSLARFLVDKEEPNVDCSIGSESEMFYFCLRVCVESPLLFQFESMSILFQALADDLGETGLSTHTGKILVGIQPHLVSAIENKPRCLEYQGNIQNNQTLRLWIEAFTRNAELVRMKDRNGVDGSNEMLSSFHKAMSGCSSERCSSRATVDSMRVLVLSSGALIAGRHRFFPTKLTPLIRNLMTSVQNESDDVCQLQTCCHLSSLLCLLVEDSSSAKTATFQKTLSKILQNLFNLMNAKAEPGCTAASRIIGSFANALPFQTAKRSLSAMWLALDPVSNGNAPNVVSCDMRQSLRLLISLCNGLSQGSDMVSYLVDKFAQVLVELRCMSTDSEARDQAFVVIKALCSVETNLMLKKILPSIAQFVQNHDDVPCRRRGCNMLRDIMQVASMSITPYVRTLLPLVMPLMTDPDAICARAAATMFSRLVQVAPLVRDSAPLQLAVTEKQKTAELVMDHLIHGKKLPPCEIRPEIANDLKSAGITLRGYQLEGVGWLRFLQTVNLNGALCDAMGLGKTLQALVAIASSHLEDTDQTVAPLSLVICPSSVVGHWVAEIRRFFPEKKVLIPVIVAGTVANRKTLWANISASGNIVVTSYSILRSDIELISKYQWRYCVLDEGHLLKNPKTATARASKRLVCRHKLLMSGTPVQNKVHEVWATFDFLMPNFLGSSTSFSSEFGKPITKSQSPGASASDIANGMEQLKALHQQVLPFILRREKEHVLKELPPKSITILPCQMSPLQKRVYDEFCSSGPIKNSIASLQKALESYNSSIANLGRDVLKSLLYLRLLCTHPVLVAVKETLMDHADQGIEHSGKLLALSELLRGLGIQNQGLTAADNDSSLLYCEDDIEDEEGDEFGGALRTGLDESLIQIDQNAATNGNSSRCLIFAQFMSSLDVVESSLLRRYLPSVAYLRLDGRVPTQDRSNIVDRFNEDNDIKILLLTTRIGGLGLNLTGADTVIFLEHDWNPHADIQAEDRAHRIGQSKCVNVYKLVTTDSIEEKIMNLHQTKLAMSNAIVNTDNSSLYSLGTDRLLDIFRFRSEASTRSASSENMEKNLDSLVELYEEEYKTLSMDNFLDGLRGGGNSNCTDSDQSRDIDKY